MRGCLPATEREREKRKKERNSLPAVEHLGRGGFARCGGTAPLGARRRVTLIRQRRAVCNAQGKKTNNSLTLLDPTFSPAQKRNAPVTSAFTKRITISLTNRVQFCPSLSRLPGFCNKSGFISGSNQPRHVHNEVLLSHFSIIMDR